jgi:hypothetical protein
LRDQRLIDAIGVVELYADGVAAIKELRAARRVTSQACDDANQRLENASNEAIHSEKCAAAAVWLLTAWPRLPEGEHRLSKKLTKSAVFHAGEAVKYAEKDAATAVRIGSQEMGHQCQLIRDIFGNPFRPVAFDPRWRSADAVALAQGIYEDRAFDRLPLLADALMDAGCDDQQVIGHCRSAGPHVRGCWVLDLVLGKE